MKSKKWFAVWVLVGGLAIHGVLAACQSVSGSSDAHAAPSDCAQWEIDVDKSADYPPKGRAIAAGWEPFSATETGTSSTVWVRRCKP